MQRSNRGSRQGDRTVTEVTFQPAAAMVFVPGTPVTAFEATLRCGKVLQAVPPTFIKKPHTHGIAGQGDAWVVLVDPKAMKLPSCKTMVVSTTSTWSDGSTFVEQAGLTRAPR